MVRTPTRRLRRALVAATALALAGTTAACAQSEREEGSGGGGGGEDAASTFVFAASSDPAMLDPAFASDGETFRVARQMFEGLVGTEPGTPDPAPLLATEWTTSPDGLTYTFQLQDGVTFHDGEPFDGEAVCANFDRWHGFTGLLQNENISYYYNKIFRGFANAEDPALQGGLYGGCEATGELEAAVTLTSPYAGFISALSLPAFSMQSPAALEEFDANNASGSEDDPRFSAYATEHPTGTGPFRFESWERGQEVRLVRNEDYWGEVAQIEEAVIRVIPDGNARLQALRNGDIDGYDLVAPGDVQSLEDDGFTIAQRDPFNILYLGLNQASPALADVRVRQAIYHAIDKEAVVSQSLPEGSEVATQYLPPAMGGRTTGDDPYPYDPDRARQLLADAGQSDLALRFNYPTDVSRPYMPSPEDTFTAISSQLEAVGITVEPVADQWTPDYLDKIQGSADHDIHLLGWTADYNDPDNVLGVFFGARSNEWGFDDPALFQALAAARQLPTVDVQEPAYQAIGEQIATLVPGVPIAHPVPSLAFADTVQGYEPSPVQDEVWNTVTIEG